MATIELDKMTVSELRKLARTELKHTTSFTGTWINSANKHSLIKAIKLNGLNYKPTGGPIEVKPSPDPEPYSGPMIPPRRAGSYVRGTRKGYGHSTPELNPLLAPLHHSDPVIEAEEVKIPAIEVKPDSKPSTNGQTDTEKALQTLMKTLAPKQQGLDVDKIREIIKDEIANQVPAKIEVKAPTGKTSMIEHPHPAFTPLLKICEQRIPAFLSGPAGSGKTTGAHQISKALDLPYYPVSVCKQTMISALVGYMDANGKYVDTLVYKAFTTGGILLIDEVDGANANVLNVLNALLANGTCSFPNGVHEKHPDFICIAAGNTWGFGASRKYVGRNPLDGAFLDRFVNIAWDYDEQLENDLAKNKMWSSYIQDIRKSVDKLHMEIIVSPRRSIFGAQLLASGMNKSLVQKVVLWNNIGDENKKKIIAHMEDN